MKSLIITLLAIAVIISLLWFIVKSNKNHF